MIAGAHCSITIDIMGKIYKDKGTESISRNLIFDNKLSDRARFVYCFMMAKPNNWDFLISPMAKELGYSPDTLHKYINELIQRGWLTKVEQSRDEQKRFGAVDYVIHETRQEVKKDDKKLRKGENPQPKKAVTENFRDGKITPQKDNIDNKEIKDLKEKKEDITSTIVDVPQSGGEGKEEEILEAEMIEDTPEKGERNKKKAEAKNEKKYTVTHRCRLAFEQQYLQFKGEEYYYAAKDANAVKQLIDKIKTKMPDDLKENEDELVQNFTVFIQAIIHSGKVERWILDNLSLPVINSKFNEIYSQLKNGTAKQPNPADIHRVFGSRNIDAGILEFLT